MCVIADTASVRTPEPYCGNVSGFQKNESTIWSRKVLSSARPSRRCPRGRNESERCPLVAVWRRDARIRNPQGKIPGHGRCAQAGRTESPRGTQCARAHRSFVRFGFVYRVGPVRSEEHTFELQSLMRI